MHASPPLAATLNSRLPKVGTTIFTVMSALATQHRAVNLGQGFPDFDCDSALVDAVTQAMKAGHNQYPPMTGIPLLRERIACKVQADHGLPVDPDSEVTVTAGATQAILTAVLALVHPGEEVIVLEPCYDSYVPAIELAGGIAVRVPLDERTYRPDFDRIKAALGPKTRAVILNSPHNPTGTIWTRTELDTLAELLRPTSTLVISDEVYEHMVYDQRRHESVRGHRELAPRSLMISSFGKTFHVTGWKVGYVVAPPPLMREFRKVHQFNVFTVNTPAQYGLASYLERSEPYEQLSNFYQGRRDHFLKNLERSRFKFLPCEGTYFVCAEYGDISNKSDLEFCEWLTREVGVAAIPLSAFSEVPPQRQRIRFCFAKKLDTLDRATALLATL